MSQRCCQGSRLLFGSLIVIATLLLLTFHLHPRRQLLVTKLNQVDWEVAWRVQWWDWKDTKEEIYCRATHNDSTHGKEPIPNILHFVLLSPPGVKAELDYRHFLALKAAVLRAKAEEIKLHTTGLNEHNHFWKQLRPHVTLVHVESRHYFTVDETVQDEDSILPHESDFLRLEILRNEGGIYLDLDVYVLKPLTDFLDNPRDTIMGHEGGNRYGLCNAVILSRPGSAFLKLWEKGHENFDPNVWNYHSVRLPKQLQVTHPDLICPLSPTVFFWPTWAPEHVRYMHEEILTSTARAKMEADLQLYDGAMYGNQVAFHAASAKEQMAGMSVDTIELVDTRFNILLREVARAEL
ncbi:hypothetical protein LTR62_007609 [Meristemomyces frigidus]|uniref:Alpha 1,4-glycosyltransferase domain-containing protein n=1 Tax=Meristemomyces frigidus TaxID=1508187 RepID=A0AAN7TAW7_9PEZI|nr:hypothetical protein LTR62_007609 [Meristemomyces frigidus]